MSFFFFFFSSPTRQRPTRVFFVVKANLILWRLYSAPASVCSSHHSPRTSVFAERNIGSCTWYIFFPLHVFLFFQSGIWTDWKPFVCPFFLCFSGSHRNWWKFCNTCWCHRRRPRRLRRVRCMVMVCWRDYASKKAGLGLLSLTGFCLCVYVCLCVCMRVCCRIVRLGLGLWWVRLCFFDVLHCSSLCQHVGAGACRVLAIGFVYSLRIVRLIVCVCVCVCVWKREREKGGGGGGGVVYKNFFKKLFFFLFFF